MPCRLQSAYIHRATLATRVQRRPTTLRTLTWKERWSSRQTTPCGQRRWGALWRLWHTKRFHAVISVITVCMLAGWESIKCYCDRKWMCVLPQSGKDSAFNWIEPTQERNWCWRPSAHHSNAFCLRGRVGWVIHLNRLSSIILHKSNCYFSYF